MGRNLQKNIIIIVIALVIGMLWLVELDIRFGILGDVYKDRIIEKENIEIVFKKSGKIEETRYGEGYKPPENISREETKKTEVTGEKVEKDPEKIIEEEKKEEEKNKIIIEEEKKETLPELECDVIVLSDFNESTCTRIRKENIGSLGFFPVGGNTNLAAAYQLGASYHRVIIQWHQAYDGLGNFNYAPLDAIFADTQRNNLKVILSLRSNHPEKSSVTFIPSERSIDDPDSIPKNEQEWKNYVKETVNRYKNRGLVAVSTINEIWQFKTNLPENHPDYEARKRAEIVQLMRMTYEAVREVDQSIPVLSPAVTGGEIEALTKGYNENGFIYVGNDNTGISKLDRESAIRRPGNTNSELYRRAVIVDGAPYYNYLDLHQRVDFGSEIMFVANWARDLLKQNGVTGKGMIATEFGGPFSYYSTPYHAYMVTAANVLAYYAGFDAVTWAHLRSLPNWVQNYNNPALFDSNGNIIIEAAEAMQRMSGTTKNFRTVRKVSENVYEFTLPSGQKQTIDTTLNVPLPPGYQ